ncbi:uncharacterized protein DS421_3g83350 [Arachis hypogaea]|nr:uncharacterized protein DS421_3g83350 [Arachis hypogaea]
MPQKNGRAGMARLRRLSFMHYFGRKIPASWRVTRYVLPSKIMFHCVACRTPQPGVTRQAKFSEECLKDPTLSPIIRIQERYANKRRWAFHTPNGGHCMPTETNIQESCPLHAKAWHLHRKHVTWPNLQNYSFLSLQAYSECNLGPL